MSLRNVTLSAAAEDIEAAREIARAQQTTLNAVFRDWLTHYIHAGTRSDAKGDAFDRLMARLDQDGVDAGGRRYTREEMNER